jgi:hypothetical protein
VKAVLDRLTEGALVVGRWELRVWTILRFRRQLHSLNKGLPW